MEGSRDASLFVPLDIAKLHAATHRFLSRERDDVMEQLLVIFVSILVFGLRPLIIPQLNQPPFNMTDLYKNFSHLFVGGLFGAWCVKRVRLWLWLAVGLSLWELVMFLIQKYV